MMNAIITKNAIEMSTACGGIMFCVSNCGWIVTLRPSARAASISAFISSIASLRLCRALSGWLSPVWLSASLIA